MLLKRKAKQAKSKRGTVIVGGWLDPQTDTVRYLRHKGPEHVLCFAPTRSGKGVGLIVPTLLTLQDSVVVTDLKGENWLLTAGYRRAAGQHTVMFNPVAQPLVEGGKVAPEAGSVRYNPLTEIRIGTREEIRDIQNIANILMDPTGTGKEGASAHWVNSAIDLTTGALLHLLYSPEIPAEKKNLAGLLAFLSSMALDSSDDPDSDPTAEAFRRLADAHHAGPTDHYYWSDQPDGTTTLTHPAVRDMAGRMLAKADRERGSVVSSTLANLSLFADPLVAANTATSEFELRDLMHADKPVSLYLVIPPGDQDRVRPLVRLILTQLIARLTESITSKPRHNLVLMLEEFPAFGRLDAIRQSIAYTAGYGIRMYLITQSLSQLKTAYGNAADDIVSNCHLRIAYAPNGVETAELLSKMCGTTTIHQQNISTSRDSMLSIVGKSHSVSLQAISRPLLTPDECLRLPGPITDGELIRVPGDMLIFVAGNPPIYGKQALFFRDPAWSARSKIPAPTVSDVLRPAVCGAGEGAVASTAMAAGALPTPPSDLQVETDGAVVADEQPAADSYLDFEVDLGSEARAYAEEPAAEEDSAADAEAPADDEPPLAAPPAAKSSRKPTRALDEFDVF